MMQQDPLKIDEATQALLDAYSDGCMTPEQADAFEQRLQDEPGLLAEYELQQRIDQALAGSLAQQMPLAGMTAARVKQRLVQDNEPAQADAIPIQRHRLTPVLRLAAMIGLAAAVGLGAWLVTRPDEPEGYAELQYVAVASVFEAELAGGFEPDWVCDNQRFTETIQEKLGAQLALAEMPGDRRMLGLSYVPRARADSVVMLGQFNDAPVLVFFDRPQLVDQFYDLQAPEGMHLHQRDVGTLRAIELSASPEPVFLDFLD